MALVERCSTEELPAEAFPPASRPEHVGIQAMEVYIPSTYVDQAELEAYTGVSPGRYTKGLEQAAMSFVTDLEDAVSMAMTATQRLLQAQHLAPSCIGRLEVGTETSVDHCKSIKTHLMQLFEASGDTDILGVDCINACYGGTAAFLNAVAWIESSGWDGRLAIVVCADVAVYPEGPARPTGGAGTVAMLIGPGASLVPCLRTATSHMQHTYDFFKPIGLWPQVDGALSVQCYLQALITCFEGLRKKQAAVGRHQAGSVMHAPFCKLVRKAHAWLHHADRLVAEGTSKVWQGMSQEVRSKPAEVAAVAAAQAAFEQQMQPALQLASQCGNSYCASVWGGLACLMETQGAQLAARHARILLFSYGSGSTSTLIDLQAWTDLHRPDAAGASRPLGIQQQLASRRKASMQEFTQALREQEHHYMACDWRPTASLDDLRPGTWYMDAVDANGRRCYQCKPS